MAGGDPTKGFAAAAAALAPWSSPGAPPPLVLARGAAAGLLAGIAAQEGDGEVLVVPTTDAAVTRLARASAPPPFVIVEAAAVGRGLGRFLRLLAEPDLVAPVLVVGEPRRAGRIARVARRLGLPACALDTLDRLHDLRTVLAGLAATPREEAPSLTATELAQAIAGGAIVNRYQPQVRLADGAPLALETLARWEHPSHGTLGPGQFIPLAETAGLAADLARRMVRRAVADMAALHRAGHRYTMALNLPLDVLLDPATADELAEAVAEGGLPPEALTIELTESQVAHDLIAVRDAALQLRGHRFGVSIDDFTLSASQTGLVSLPFSEMKLDRSLVVAALADRTVRGALASVVRMAHGLGLVVVAEGIETPQAWVVAREIGADLAQGWMVGRPLPAGAVAAWAASWIAAGRAGARS
ncbi:EAL domain-containing protein [Elioraea tepidiphila]|uniref:EAL domain-containing protein n=1 Tax=Elioraea tepidiphila TaxID=457934 RepID=UPI00037DF085|nr:EAL domain-containing protein [Elioraea tepidiphila]